MTTAYEWLAAASSWWWPRFADHLWQTTLFTLLILGASLAVKRGPAIWRHTLCLIVSLKFILPVALFVFLAQQTGLPSLLAALQPGNQNALLLAGITEPIATMAATYEVTVAASTATGSENIYLALTVVWLAGACLILLFWAARRRRFTRSLRLGRSLQQGREWQALGRAQQSLRMKRSVELLVSPLKIEPGVWRVRRPVIVLPESMGSLLDDDELEAILLHEMIHIQRRDNLIGHLQLTLCAVLWFHPLVWFISRRLFDEREQVCDERVLEMGGTREAYAASILKVVRFCFGWRVAGVIGAASGSNLRRRIENIMSTGNTKHNPGRASRLLAAALLSLALLILVAAGVYTRPLTVAAAISEKATAAGITSNPIAAPEAVTDKRQSKQTKPAQPPAPPPSPAAPAEPSKSAAPAQPSQPAQPPQPPVPDEQEIDDSDQPGKDKPPKEKLQKGELIEAPRPAYPDEVKQKKIAGTVVVVITIGDDGKVIYAKAKSGPEELYGVSEAAALKARFEPTIVKGEPVKVSGVMSYNFELDK
jgi:TonB family protein